MNKEMIIATAKTLANKKTITKNVKAEALRFYFMISKEKPNIEDKEWLDAYFKLVDIMKERKILNE